MTASHVADAVDPETAGVIVEALNGGATAQGWRVAEIVLKCKVKGEVVDHVVAGWSNGIFGLDFRVFADDAGDYVNGGYTITHMPTGMVVRQLIGVGTAEAKALADEILNVADWSFTGSAPEACKHAVAVAMREHPGVVTSGHSLIGPAL